MKYWSFIDEEKILEKLLEDPSSVSKDSSTKIKVLIKHYKRLGYSKNEIRNMLDEFLMKYYLGFVLADWDDKLKRWVNKYTKQENCDFKKMEDVVIYKEELDFIARQWNIEGELDIEVEKLLFIMLVLAKSSSDGSWMNYTDIIAFDLARYNFKRGETKQIQRGKMLYKLSKHDEDILECLKYSNKIKLRYNKTEGEEVFRITRDTCVENIITMYLDWRGYPNYKYCRCCGKEIKVMGNRQKYCPKCAKEIEKNNTKNRVKKHRNREM